MANGGPPVGREIELAGLDELVDGVAVGRGGVLLVRGEAGIGKTRLLGEAARRARVGGLVVLTGRAVEGGGAYRPLAEALAGRPLPDAEPLRPYRAALGRLSPEWAGEPSPSNVDPVVVLGQGLVRLLGILGGSRGCLLILEDLHWADADTLAVLEYLSGALLGSSVLVAASARDEGGHAPVLDRIGRRPEVALMGLGRLSPAETIELAERCAPSLPGRVRRAVVEKSDGLPFLVEELVADGVAGGVPPTFAGMVEVRLRALGPRRRRVVEAAAVLGEPDWTLLGAVTGLAEDAVHGALRAAQPRLVVPEGRGLRWRHALTREAVLAAIPPAERAALARRAGEALLGRDEVRAAELLRAAGDGDRAAEIFLRLAARDLDRGAPRDARAKLERAGDGAGAAVERVRLLTLLGEADAALAAGTAALAVAVGDDHARLCLRLADAAVLLGHWDEAERYLERAGRPRDPRALVLAADAAFGPGDLERAELLASAAVERAEHAGDAEALCRALIVRGRCALRRDFAASRAFYRRAARHAAEHGLRPWRVTALLGLAFVELDDGPCSPALDEARALALETGQLAEVVHADLLQIERRYTAEGPRAAAALAEETAELAGRLGLPGHQVVAELFIAFARAVRGEVEGASAALDAARSRPAAPVEIEAMAHAVWGLRELMDHDLAAADRCYDAAMRILEGRHETVMVAEWGLWALIRSVLGDDGARETLRGSSEVFRRVNRGALHYADAVAAGREGRPEAAALFAAGDRALVHHPWWRRLCRLLALEAAVTCGWGDPVPELRADLAAYERTGEEAFARTARDLLRRAGAPARRGRGLTSVPPELRAAGVTSREMDVLTLVGEGLTDRQVAERLFLSPRTVETHVASLLAKTGAAGRAQLRAQSLPKQGASSL
ncbi:ATP-binding protein [Spirillospora sp. CA-294931]|uniref:ATP-binding protein n=1 Tax=Spirillospora sp. CA-294931 TaxID=3240042 RepID=UPI003D949A86